MELILEALNYINAADCTYQEWVQVGMALKEEGYPVSVWDSWSRNDTRYHEGECDSKWGTFGGGDIKGGTIVQMAKDRGFAVTSAKSGVFDFDYEINEADKSLLAGTNTAGLSGINQLI